MHGRRKNYIPVDKQQQGTGKFNTSSKQSTLTLPELKSLVAS